MKKKLLSLVLAGAMVASTSVSAFAETQTVTTSDDRDGSAEVEVTGKVLNESGEEAPGVFKVTVPTTASFLVDQNASVTSATIKITNAGAQDIDVYADQFKDLTNNDGDGITVVAENSLQSKNRTYVNLNIRGNQGNVYLKTESDSTEKGLYKDSNLAGKATGEDLKLISLQSGQEGNLTLEGKAGKENTTQPKAVNNNFVLTLKIKKAGK